jgi:hypothetical protein
MRKLLFALVLCVAGMVAHAQNYPTDYASQIGTTRTLANATPDTVSFSIGKSRSAITVKYDIIKNSGTVAGTIVLQGKITAANSTEAWTTINSYTLTDATAVNSVLLTANHYSNYRVITTPSGTQNSTHKKYLLYRGY